MSEAARRSAGPSVALLVLAGCLVVPAVAAAAEPTPSPIGGDPRSAGEGPGLVGEPLMAIGVVILIAVLAVAATLAWIRLTAPHADRPDRPSP